MSRLALVVCAALCLFPGVTIAQTVRERVIVTTVRDSANRPVADVDVSLREGLSDTVVSGMTDRSGRVTLRTLTRASSIEVVARRIPFLASYRYVRFGTSDTTSVALTLVRPAHTLDTVVVTEREATRKAKMTIDADAIASSTRNIGSGLDVVLKLRPDMVYGLAGRAFCDTARVTQVWVNGIRMWNVPPAAMAAQRRQEELDAHFKRPPPYASMSPDMLYVLTTIKPEHIASIEMSDCTHPVVQQNGHREGMFISLKPGIGFEPGVGSLVQGDEEQLGTLRRIMMQRRSSSVLLPTGPARLPRLLGLFDWDTGEPVAGADVIDAATGTRASSSETGTVPLDFVSSGAALLVVERPGYRTDSLHVKISPSDTIPITVLLRRVAVVH